MVKPIPDGYHTLTPYITTNDLRGMLDFIQKAFGATVSEVMTQEDGTPMHAEAKIGDSILMLGQSRGEWTPRPATLYLYVEDTDATYRSALAAGAASIMEPADQFYGDRNGGVSDAFGNWWWIATRVEDVAPDEMLRRARTRYQ